MELGCVAIADGSCVDTGFTHVACAQTFVKDIERVDACDAGCDTNSSAGQADGIVFEATADAENEETKDNLDRGDKSVHVLQLLCFHVAKFLNWRPTL